MWDRIRAEQFLKESEEYGSVLGLSGIQNLMEELGQVQEELKIIHVAGTNGKGSVCAMLANILKQGGLKTGKYSSPAVFCPEEKFQIDGENISWEKLSGVLFLVWEACERLTGRDLPHPTLFEIETAAAFLWFYQEKCQVVVLETGLGGAGDATNIIRKPLCSVITSVSMDHMKFLGDTVEEIAGVKAGIIKEGCPVVCVKQSPGVLSVIREVCERKHADLLLADPAQAENIRYDGAHLVFDWENLKEISLPLLGAYQVENAVCAIQTILRLNGCGFGIADETLAAGLETVRWPGRFEVIARNPLVILDGAHNAGGAERLRETLEMGFRGRRILYIIGVLADKEHEQMLDILLPLAEKVYTVTPEHPRALSGERLCEKAKARHHEVIYVPDREEAMRMAVREAGEDENAMVLAFGSLSYLKDMKNAVSKEGNRKEEQI